MMCVSPKLTGLPLEKQHREKLHPVTGRNRRGQAEEMSLLPVIMLCSILLI